MSETPRQPAPRPRESRRADLAALALRVGLAAVLIPHALHKILGPGSGWGANWLADLINAPLMAADLTPYLTAVQLAVAWGELLGGAALLLGLLTRPAALGAVLLQGCAAYLAASSDAFSFTKAGGPEFNLVLLAMGVVALLLGGGRFSFDRLPGGRRSAPPAERADVPAPRAEPLPALAAH
jgi:putative oxidoreductase